MTNDDLVEDIANCRAGGGQSLQAILPEAGITLAGGSTTNSECLTCRSLLLVSLNALSWIVMAGWHLHSRIIVST